MYYLFYIPVGTEARVRRTPWGTIALVGANLGVFLYFLTVPGSEPDFYRFMQSSHPEVGQAIANEKALSDELSQQLETALDEFKKTTSVASE